METRHVRACLREQISESLTGSLVAAFVGAAFYDREVAALIAGPMGITLGCWFKERERAG